VVSRIAAILLAAAIAAAGCREEPAPPAPSAPEEDATAGEEVGILRAFPPSTSGGHAAPAREILRDAPSWAAAWKRANAHMAPIPAAPEVDFSKEMVALAALGEKPSAGFGVEIVGARLAEGKLRILYAEHEAPPGGMAATVITHPWHAVVIARTDDPVEWVRYAAPTPAPPK
jgi:protease stability complex PrcB-like protein